MTELAKLRIERIPARRLTSEMIEAVWRCYARSGRRALENLADALRGADEVYVCREGSSSAVRGFKANKLLRFSWEGRPITVVYTLFAALDHEWRGSNVLQRIFLRRFLTLKALHPLRPTYWVFMASTYLSYLVLPRNFVSYWPSRHETTPARALALMDAVMRRACTTGWDAASGVVKRSGGTNYLEGVIESASAVPDDPDIQFYAKCNPGQSRGDTLVCLCRFDMPNAVRVLTRALARFFRSHQRKTAEDRRDGGNGGSSKRVHTAEPRVS